MTEKSTAAKNTHIKLELQELEHWNILHILSQYRFTIACILITLFAFNQNTIVGHNDRILYLSTTIFYLFFAIVILFLIKNKKQIFITNYSFQVLLDIFLIALLTYSSGGTNSGLYALIIPSITAGCIINKTRTAYVYPAITTILILSEQIYISFLSPNIKTDFVHSGLIGLVFFSVTMLIRYIAVLLNTSYKTISMQKEDLSYLESINELILKKLPFGFIVIDNNLEIKYFNSIAKQYFFKVGLTINKNISNLSPYLYEKIINFLEKGQTSILTDKTFVAGKQFKIDFIQVSSKTVEPSNKDNVLIFVEDFSLHNQYIQNIKLASIGKFTAGIAHEIRNPLSSISHASELLKENNNLTTNQKELLDIIINNSNRTSHIVHNVLSFAKTAKNNPEKINLKQHLINFIKNFTLPNIKEIMFDTKDLLNNIEIIIDKIHFDQILTNLFENGIRYSLYETGKPMLSLKSSTSTTNLNHHYLDIIDFGPGINNSDQKLIYEPFYTTYNNGTGLGLYIAKELCIANNLCLDYIKNKKKGGSFFRIIFNKKD